MDGAAVAENPATTDPWAAIGFEPEQPAGASKGAPAPPGPPLYQTLRAQGQQEGWMPARGAQAAPAPPQKGDPWAALGFEPEQPAAAAKTAPVPSVPPVPTAMAPRPPVPPQKSPAAAPTMQGFSETMATISPKGLVEPGNLRIWNRPTVQNADGTHSSEYSVSFSQDGKEVLVPTIVDGKFLTPDGKKPPEGSPQEKAMFQEAWKHYLKTGEHLGKFDNPSNADAYAGVLHSRGTTPTAPPAKQTASRPLDTVESYDPSPLDILRHAVANSAPGYALASTMPAISHALHIEPTETEAERARTGDQNRSQMVNPGAVMDEMTQPAAQAFSEALRAGGFPVPPLPPGVFRENTTQPKPPLQNVLTGAANALGAQTTPGNLALMALPIGEVAGLTGKLGESVIPRLVSGGFSLQMIRGLYDQAIEYKKDSAAGDTERAQQILGEMAATAPMLFMAGHHALVSHGVPAPRIAPENVEAYRARQAEQRSADQNRRYAEPQAAGPEGTRNLAPETADPWAALGFEPERPASASNPVSRGTPGAAREADAAAPVSYGTNGTEGTAAHPPIGAEEPETGRPVLQQSPRAEVSQAAATAEHPAVKDTIAAAVKPIDGAKISGARDEKDPERLDEKIEDEGQSPRTVRDLSGFRIAVDTPAARDQVVEALKQKFEVVDEQDNFDKGDEEHGFHAHTVQVREPGSPVTHEVQILPREVAENADSDHGLYEKARDGDKDAAAQLKAKNQQNWQEFQARQEEMPAAASSEGDKSRPWSTDSVMAPEGTQVLASGSQRSRPSEPETTRSMVPSESVKQGAISTLGAIDRTSQKIIHQPEGDATEQMRRAREIAPQFQKLLDGLSAEYGATNSGVNLKSQQSVERKLALNPQRPAHTIADYIRARLVFDTVADVRAAAQEIKEKFGSHDVEDFIDKDKHGYRAVHLQIHLPNGQSAELQLIPREIHEAQQSAHDDYEIFRDTSRSDEDRAAARARSEAAFEQAWKKQQAREARSAEPRYKHGNTQVNIPADSPAAQALNKFRAAIPADHLAGDGRDVGAGGNHVTVRYGIQGDDTDDIEKYIRGLAPFTARLGETDVFPPSEHSDGAAVVHARVEAPELTRINDEIQEHGDFAASSFKDYKPHATIAYIDPRQAEAYKGRGDLKGAEFPVNSITISDRDGRQREIPLEGTARKGGRGESPEAPVAHPAGEDLPAGAPGVRQTALNAPEAAPGGERAPEGENRAVLADSGEMTLFGNPRPGEQQPRAGEVKPGEVGSVPTRTLTFDPQRFQYKMNTDASGVTNLLKGRRWNPDLAGVITAWRDPADGKTYVVNGHHRAQLAVENRVANVDVRMLNAPDAATARSIGALQNIAEGRGTPLDAAKFFRDSGYTPAELDKSGISMGEATANNGVALARLDQHLFDEAVAGRLGLRRAIAIGRATDVPEQQDAILKLIQRAEQKGRKVSEDTIDELARMVRGAGEHTETQQTLFGAQEMKRNLAIEKAEISQSIREQIGREKRLFGGVADEGKAARLATTGNVINAAENARISRDAAQAQELYDRLSTRGGAIGELLNRAAHALAEGKENANTIKQRAYIEARAELAKTLGNATPAEPGRVSETGAGKPEAPRPPKPPARPASGQTESQSAGGGAAERNAVGSGLKPPRPPWAKAEEPQWSRGDHFLVRDAQGGYAPGGTVEYWNPRINDAKAGGRAKLADGTKLDKIPSGAVRVTKASEEIKPRTGTPQEKKIIDAVHADRMGYLHRYMTGEAQNRGGRLSIAVDGAKKLIPGYNNDPVGTEEDATAAAIYIRDMAEELALQAPFDPARPDVQIATASPGSGKTTLNANGAAADTTAFNIEHILTHLNPARDMLQRIIDSGRKPVITWVHVDDFGTTVDRMFRRALGDGKTKGIGRTVPLDYMVDAYRKVPRTLEKLKAEFGDQITIQVVDNSGAPGQTAKPSLDVQPYIDGIKRSSYNQLLGEGNAKIDELQREGLFESARGKAALESVRPAGPGDQPERAASTRRDDQGSGERESQLSGKSAPAGAVLEKQGPGRQGPGDRDQGTERRGTGGGGGESAPAGSVSDEEFEAQMAAARGRSLRHNAASHQAQVLTPTEEPLLAKGTKAVRMDADAYGVWHRAGLGEGAGSKGVVWRGMTLPRALANRVETLLRGLAGSARTEAGGAGAAAGYDRLIKAFREGRNEDGSVILLRADYRADTVREELIHAWQRAHRMEESDAIRMIAQRPEVKEIAAQLDELGYGRGTGVQARTELALEMMAKAMAGDPGLKMTADQRFGLVHSFLTAARDEMGPGVWKDLPAVAEEAAAAVNEARANYESSDEGSRRPGTRGQGTGNDGGAQGRSGVEERPRERGPGRGRAAGGDEPGAGEAGAPEDQLGPQYQRARTTRLAGEQPLPGFGEAVREQDEAAAARRGEELSQELLRPAGDITKAAGEMERNAPLFSGSDANPQFSLFQRDNGTPMLPLPDRNAATDKELDERIDRAKAGLPPRPPRPEGTTEAAPAKRDVESPVARSIQSMVDDLEKMPRNDGRTALEKAADWTGRTYDDATSRAGKAWRGAPSKLEQAWAHTKLVYAALVDGLRNPLKESDWKQSVGQMQLAQAETAQKLKALAREMKASAPDRMARIGMTHWIEAGGDPRKLDQWAQEAKSRWRNANGDNKVPNAVKEAWADAVDHYDAATRLTPEQKAVAQRVKAHMDEMLEEAKKNGLLEFGARNYVRHLYEQNDASADLMHLIDTSELAPDPGFIEKRVFRTYMEAENHGLIPRNKDLAYLTSAYDQSFSEALASRAMLRNLLDGKASDGRPLAAIKMRGKWVLANENQRPLVMQQRQRPASLQGYREYDLPQTRGFLFEPTKEDLEGYDPKLFEEDPEKLAFKGDLIFHPEIAGRVEDMLTPGWFDRNETAPQKIGNKILKGSALAKEFMTALAPFHMVQEGIHSTEHMVNPFKVHDVDLSGKTERSRKLRLLASNGLSLTNFDAEGLFSARAMKGLGEGIPGVNVALDALHSFSRWQFEDYIPGLKADMALHAFDRNRARYPKLSERQVAEMTAKQANAAFGNLNTAFDSMHRSKTFKQLLRLTTFAPDFLEARMRFVGQAFTRYGGEQRAALIRGALVMYAAARIANAVLNEGDAKWDAEHAFSVVHDGKSYSLRTVQGDMLHAVTDPRGFIYNRMNPLTTRPLVEFLSGRDQYGRQKSFKHQVEDVGKSALPFFTQKVMQTSDESWLNSILTSTGVQAGNYRTPAEEMTHKLYLQSIPDLPDDEEREAASREHAQMEQSLREGKIKPADVLAQAKDGKITWRQAWRTVERAQRSRLQNEFMALKLRDAMDVYAKASDVEKLELKAELARKARGLEELPEADRAETLERLRGLLAEAHPTEAEPKIH